MLEVDTNAQLRSSDYCFFITPLGTDASQERARADEIETLIIAPVLSPFGLSIVRADKLAQPGVISAQIIRLIMGARLLVADVSGANANVYYELGVAHSLGKPVVTLVDKVRSLAFDIAHQRAIVLGDDGVVSLAQGKEAETQLRAFVASVLDDAYQPTSVVTEAAGFAVLDELAPDDPVLAALNQNQDDLRQIRNLVENLSNVNRDSMHGDVARLRTSLERLIRLHGVDLAAVKAKLIDGHTSDNHDAWVNSLEST